VRKRGFCGRNARYLHAVSMKIGDLAIIHCLHERLSPETNSQLYPFSLLSVALQAYCEPTLEGGVVAPQNQFNVESSWEKGTELESLHTDVISS